MLPDMQSSNPLARMLALYDAAAQLMDEARSSNGLFQRVTVGAGGMIFKDGGGIEVLSGGQIVARGGSITAVDEVTNSIAQLFESRLWFAYDWDNPVWGFVGIDSGGDNGVLRILPPAVNTELRNRNSITVQGSTDSEPGNVWVYTDGGFQVNADGPGSLVAGGWRITAGGELGLYELPTTGGTADLRLGTINGVWTVGRVTSSRRYKQDIEDVRIDPLAVLAWRPRSWRDKAEVEAVGDDAPRFVGFIAEEVQDAGTPEFVTHDDDGQVDGLTYDRMTVGLHALAVHQEERITTLESENTALKSQLADVLARLDALEAA